MAKLITKTHYDRKSGKLIREKVPESSQHKALRKRIGNHKQSLPSLGEAQKDSKFSSDYQKRHKRAYNE